MTFCSSNCVHECLLIWSLCRILIVEITCEYSIAFYCDKSIYYLCVWHVSTFGLFSKISRLDWNFDSLETFLNFEMQNVILFAHTQIKLQNIVFRFFDIETIRKVVKMGHKTDL